ncbi:SMC-Scp complex subunit ScpB [Patescibacteria group bacterium]|nr:SMC-Scp complex subunit ScpB [Patescibacteria group bacterium]
MTDLEKRIEAILFVCGEPTEIGRLGELLSSNSTLIRDALLRLDENLASSALRLVYGGDSVQLATREHFAGDIEALVRKEVSADLSRAARETLAVVTYRGPVSKRDLDYIRGVNSTYILRGLSIRGLIERTSNPKDARTYLYQPSIEFLKFLGIGRVEELPEYESFRGRLQEFASREPNSEE